MGKHQCMGFLELKLVLHFYLTILVEKYVDWGFVLLCAVRPRAPKFEEANRSEGERFRF